MYQKKSSHSAQTYSEIHKLLYMTLSVVNADASVCQQYFTTVTGHGRPT